MPPSQGGGGLRGNTGFGVWSGKYLTWYINSLELSDSSGSYSLSSLPGALSCHRQAEQYGDGVSHQNLTPTSQDLEIVGMANQRLPIDFDLSDGVFQLGGSIPPNGGFFNPGVRLMPWTQLTAQLVQCWCSCKISFHYHPESLCCGYCCSKRLKRCSAGYTCFFFLLYAWVKCLRLVRPPSFPSWDLSVDLK